MHARKSGAQAVTLQDELRCIPQHILLGFCGRAEILLVLRDPVERGVRKSLAADEAAHGDGVGLASQNTVFVHFPNVDLHGSMILPGDEPVARRAERV